MNLTLKTLAICLVTSTTLFASQSMEDASQAPHGTKRLAEVLTHEDADTPKKIKKEEVSQEETPEEEMAQEASLVLLDLPPEVLTRMAQNLSSNKDLLTLAAVNQQLFDIALTVFYKRNSPTRIWTSGLSFSDDLEGEMLRFTFTAK
ncbi:MAG: hypothetical protein C0514_09375, partial [Candidatus Puniceispirillum sp.]|nr:hypothetical protein [Candidatus Puniceispirillum sp.]